MRKTMLGSTDNTTPVFLIGAPRSGTSLLRAILHKYSNIAIPVRGELQFFANWFGKYGDLSDAANRDRFTQAFFEKSKFHHIGVHSEAVLRRSAEKEPTYPAFFSSVMEEFASQAGKARWGEKSTSHILHLPLILKHFPSAQCILIARDPRDTFLSFTNAYWRKGTRLDAFTWAAAWSRAYRGALQALLDSPPERFCLYRHERMVLEPETESSRVLAFLGEQGLKERIELDDIDWSQNSSFGDSSKAISTSSVGRWKNKLPKTTVRDIEAGAGDVMEMLGYPFSGRPPRPIPSLGARLRKWQARFANLLPKRP